MSTQDLIDTLDKQNEDRIVILTALIAHDVPPIVADKVANRMKVFNGSPRQFEAANIAHNYKINHIVDRPPNPPYLVVVYSPMPGAVPWIVAEAHLLGGKIISSSATGAKYRTDFNGTTLRHDVAHKSGYVKAEVSLQERAGMWLLHE